MKNFKYINLSGWNNFPKIKCKTFRPEKINDIDLIIKNTRKNFICRGQGKSYGDASINQNGVILTERLDKFLSFDKLNGIIKLQSGLILRDINKYVTKAGWQLPVMPGTQLASVGGAFSCNVHGKNNYVKGEFADHVIEITLLMPNNKKKKCSPYKNKNIFWSTAGGMGLTGIILDVKLKLIRAKSALVIVETKKVENLNEMINLFKDGKSTHEYMVGWIDGFGRGKKLGKGLFQKANFKQNNDIISSDKLFYKKPKITIPFNFPHCFLNKVNINIFNKLKLLINSQKWQSKEMLLNSFLTPLDNIINWNKLYGAKGLIQYQFIIPDNIDLLKNLNYMLLKIQENKINSFLTVIKYHKKSKGLFSFSIDGFSVACDFPNEKNVKNLIQELNKTLLKFNGRVYLAKDSLLSEEIFKKMYNKNFQTWKKNLKAIPQNQILSSMMSKRLKLKNE
jgi:decaprenylphospho-beta-D-ribofuranose 2-oxidase